MSKVLFKHVLERTHWHGAPDTYSGRVIVMENGLRIWSITTGINRLTKADAKKDIESLKSELKETHCV